MTTPRLARILAHPSKSGLMLLCDSDGKVIRRIIFAAGSLASRQRARNMLANEARSLGLQLRLRKEGIAHG